jgi:tetratricopeptide (TPR) repeat protein
MHAATHDLSQALRRVRRLQYAEDVADLDYKLAMEVGDFEMAEELVRQHPNAWTRYTRLSSIRGQQGRLGDAIDALNRAEVEVRTLRERSAHLANLAYYSITLGEYEKSIDYGVEAVLLNPTTVMGAVNACCAASVQRSRSRLVDLLKLFSERAPSVLASQIWFERWQNDPQLAFARVYLNRSRPTFQE